jgi:hypothetical protein
MDIYGHLFESSSDRTADAMEAMFEQSLAAGASNLIQIGGGR